MGAKLGINAKLYYRSAGSYGSPTWTEADLLSDVQVEAAWDEAEANARYSRIKLALKSLLGLTVNARLLKSPGDAQYEFLMNAALTDDVVDFLVLDGPKEDEDTRGWRFDGLVFSLSEDQSLANALYDELMIKPTPSSNPPKAVLVAAGPTLTFSEPGVDGDTFV